MKSPLQAIKVTHIVSGDLWAGAEVQVFTLVKKLHLMEGISVSVILLNHGELENHLRDHNIHVEVIPESQLNGLQIFLQIRKILKQLLPDVVHTHRLKENILGSLASYTANKIPSLRTVHGAPEHRPSWSKPHKRFLYTLDWLVGRFLQDKIVAVSDDLAKFLQSKFPVEKICVIENGVDADEILNQTKYLPQSPRKNSKCFRVGLIGRLVPVKRIDIFIKTARYIIDHYPNLDLCFNIYGDGPLRKELERLSNGLEVTNIVDFKGHCDDIYRRICGLDALLLTSDHEGLPMTLLEAMVLKIPIIAHATGGIPKLLSNGTNGLLSYDHTPADYAHKIIELFNDSDTRSRITQNAFLHAIQYYSAEGNADSYLNTYNELISNSM